MKTIKYSIQFDNLESLNSGDIEISKAEFNRQLRHYRNQISTTAENECPVEEHEPRVKEYDTYTETSYIFACACATVWLTEIKCKDGYCFKRK